MTFAEVIEIIKKMPNGERIKLLKYLYDEHFNINPLTKEEMRIISDLRDGYVKVVENDE